MSIDSLYNNNFNAIFDITKYIIKFYLTWDLKGLFQIVRRIDFDSSYCIHCNFIPKIQKSQYIVSYKPTPSTLQTLETIKAIATEQNQKAIASTSFVSVSIYSIPILDVIPLHRYLPLVIYLLLSFRNDTYSKFKDQIAQRIEYMSNEEREAQNMSLISEIKYNKELVYFDNIKKELLVLRDERIDINNKLKIRDISAEYEKSLH